MTPIGVFAYNRPRHLQLCLEAISRSQKYCGKEFAIHIFCDAPKKDADVEMCKATQEIAKNFGKAKVICREKNRGFANITEGISELCNTFGRAIVIEDDVLVAPDFLQFMDRALEKYEHEEKVFMISGFMYHGMENFEKESFFLRSTFIWGWATWARAWKHYDWNPKGWRALVDNPKERKLFDFYNSHPFSKCLEKTMTGKWNTWDAQWMCSHFQLGALTLYPSRSLVWNCGVGSGVHGKAIQNPDPHQSEREVYIHGNNSLEDFQKPKISANLALGKSFPDRIECNKKAMRSLAVIFLQERLRKNERKKWRLHLKQMMQKVFLRFVKSP